jgi:catechol 2,3-dioxygenase-like lactoylglutathione lyase family enzyme
MAAVPTRLSGPVIGCGDAFALAEFWAALLGWTVVDRSERVPGAWALVRSPSGEHKLEFQREEPFVPPVWPTVEGAQQMGMHLDVAVEDLDAGVAFATSLGARVADHQPQAGRVVVMLDPAGHPFCLFPGRV